MNKQRAKRLQMPNPLGHLRTFEERPVCEQEVIAASLRTGIRAERCLLIFFSFTSAFPVKRNTVLLVKSQKTGGGGKRDIHVFSVSGGIVNGSRCFLRLCNLSYPIIITAEIPRYLKNQGTVLSFLSPCFHEQGDRNERTVPNSHCLLRCREGSFYGCDESCFYSKKNAEDAAFDSCMAVFVLPVFRDCRNSGVCGRRG